MLVIAVESVPEQARNSPDVRARICTGLDWLGAAVDAERNAALTSGAEGRFDRDGSRLQLWVIPTDEEPLIARDTWRVVTGAPPVDVSKSTSPR